jgi:glycosyltransferase involved in cell wall biosynthesis
MTTPPAARSPSGPPRRIGINASWMAPGQAGGMEWYVRNLVREFQRLDDRHEWVVVTSPANWHLFELTSRRWTKVAYVGDEHTPFSYVVRTPPRPAARRQRARRALTALFTPSKRRWFGGLNDLIRHERLDLWFCPLMYALPVDVEIPVVNTIPDLQHEHFPDFLPAQELALRTLGYRYSCARAAATIGISGFVAQDLLKRYRLERVVGIPLALDPSYAAGPDDIRRLIDRVRLQYRLDRPFIYYPANGWRHKDHETLVRAFRLVRERRRDLQLVLTGCEFDVMQRVRPLLEGSDDGRAVRHLGYVDRSDTIGLYGAARAMVFPSRFEGFGFPLLEAMSLGTPIVCSSVTSIPEVAGDAAVYVDPGQPTALAEAVLRVLDDEKLRERLIAAGRNRLRGFDFAETARQTLAVFEDVLSGAWRAPELPPFRPLIPHHWLQDGHSRWYFHCVDVREVRLGVAQPTELPELAAQRIRVDLDERCVLEAPIEPLREYTFTIRPTTGGVDFHRLDVRATQTAPSGGELLSLQVRTLIIVDGQDREIRLVG